MILPNSLRLRMTVLFCGVSCVLLAGCCLVFYLLLQTEVRQEKDSQLLELARPVIAEILNFPQGGRISHLDITDHYFELLDPDGRVTETSVNLGGRALPLSPGQIDPVLPAFLTLHEPRFGEVRVVLIPFRRANQQRVLAVAVPSRAARVLTDFRQLLELLLPVGLLFTTVISAWYVSKSLRPVRDLTRHAAEATGLITDPQRRGTSISLVVENPSDELGRLATTFNQVFARMDAIFSQMRQFVTDASHELRTPLSILLGETELILSDRRTVQEYEQSLKVLESELKRLSRIVEGLFTLSMADAGQLHIAKDPLYLDELLADACALASTRALAKDIEINQCMPGEPIPYIGDEAFLRQLFVDLLDNAIKYSPNSTCIRVRLMRTNDVVRIEFEDEGIGIAEAHRDRVFERFFRVHPSSGEGQSGGLGLAIAQAIVTAHQGSIHLRSTLGRGSNFTVILPHEQKSTASLIADNGDASEANSRPCSNSFAGCDIK
jgi:two-component system OmpR family sensor kinase